MTTREFWNNMVPTDANKTYVSDPYAMHFSHADLFRFAEAYHKNEMNITDADIEAWAEGEFVKMESLDPRVDIVKQYAKDGMIIGAKMMRDGKIKRNVK